ncbi:MAG: hypothetical protein ABIK43_04170, partial [candidate division WOR-3 bacterium]
RVGLRVTKTDTLVYLDSLLYPAVPPGDTLVVRLRLWRAEPGNYFVGAWVFAMPDSIRDNDSLFRVVVVESLSSIRWIELAPVPAGPRAAAVGAGGSLAVLGSSLFALKGGGVSEFYRYVAAGDTWCVLTAMPREPSGRGVKGGGALVSDGKDFLFALKGYRTREFWRYCAGADSWSGCASLPAGLPPARFGTGLTFVPQRDTAKIFCVKGGGTTDFLVYWVSANQWHIRRAVPLGSSGKKPRRGTAIVNVGGRVFVLKGGTNEFYEYHPRSDDWFARASMPATGRGGYFRRCRDGAALTSDGTRFVYALRGGCCNEFWRYDILRDTWEQLEDVPAGSGIEWVRAGAALAYMEGRVYCLKGRGSRALWCYECTTRSVQPMSKNGSIAAAEGDEPVESDRCRSLPRIVRAGAGPLTGAEVVVRDAAGRVLAPEAGLLGVKQPGVYFIRLKRSNRPAYKLVIVR